MSESVFLSGMHGAIPDALEDPGRVIALGPGLNGTVWLYHTNRAVHLDHNALRDLLFLRNTAVIYDAGGTVVLSPSGPDGLAIRLPSGLVYIIVENLTVNACQVFSYSLKRIQSQIRPISDSLESPIGQGCCVQHYIPRAALAAAARGLTRSWFDPMPSV